MSLVCVILLCFCVACYSNSNDETFESRRDWWTSLLTLIIEAGHLFSCQSSSHLHILWPHETPTIHNIQCVIHYTCLYTSRFLSLADCDDVERYIRWVAGGRFWQEDKLLTGFIRFSCFESDVVIHVCLFVFILINGENRCESEAIEHSSVSEESFNVLFK